MRRVMASLALFSALAGVPVACDSDDEPEEGAGTGDRAETDPGRTVPVPHEIAGPTEVEESGEPAAVAVERILGEDIDEGQPVVIGARCHDGRCVVRYRSVARGSGTVLQQQAPILRRLFAEKSVRLVLLYVHHQSTGSEDKTEEAAFATTRCRRADHPGFAWKRIGPGDVARVCRSTHVAGGRQRSLVRRGLLSKRETSRGRGHPGRGPPPGKGPPGGR